MTVIWVANIASATTFLDRITQNDQDVVVTNDINDPFRDGAHNPWRNVDGLYYQWGITTFLQAQNQTIAYIQRMVNWALSFIWVIALVYLLYHGFLMLTAAGDETQFKKWVKAVRTAVIALVWIAVSAFVVNFILYLVSKFNA